MYMKVRILLFLFFCTACSAFAATSGSLHLVGYVSDFNTLATTEVSQTSADSYQTSLTYEKNHHENYKLSFSSLKGLEKLLINEHEINQGKEKRIELNTENLIKIKNSMRAKIPKGEVITLSLIAD